MQQSDKPAQPLWFPDELTQRIGLKLHTFAEKYENKEMPWSYFCGLVDGTLDAAYPQNTHYWSDRNGRLSVVVREKAEFEFSPAIHNNDATDKR